MCAVVHFVETEVPGGVYPDCYWVGFLGDNAFRKNGITQEADSRAILVDPLGDSVFLKHVITPHPPMLMGVACL